MKRRADIGQRIHSYRSRTFGCLKLLRYTFDGHSRSSVASISLVYIVSVSASGLT